MSRPVPEKGKPNFSNLDDKHLNDSKEVVENLIGAFDFDPDVVSALTKAWKALCDECVVRTCKKPDLNTKSEKTTQVLKKRLVRSPFSRKKN